MSCGKIHPIGRLDATSESASGLEYNNRPLGKELVPKMAAVRVCGSGLMFQAKSPLESKD